MAVGAPSLQGVPAQVPDPAPCIQPYARMLVRSNMAFATYSRIRRREASSRLPDGVSGASKVCAYADRAATPTVVSPGPVEKSPSIKLVAAAAAMARYLA